MKLPLLLLLLQEKLPNRLQVFDMEEAPNEGALEAAVAPAEEPALPDALHYHAVHTLEILGVAKWAAGEAAQAALDALLQLNTDAAAHEERYVEELEAAAADDDDADIDEEEEEAAAAAADVDVDVDADLDADADDIDFDMSECESEAAGSPPPEPRLDNELYMARAEKERQEQGLQQDHFLYPAAGALAGQPQAAAPAVAPLLLAAVDAGAEEAAAAPAGDFGSDSAQSSAVTAGSRLSTCNSSTGSNSNAAGSPPHAPLLNNQAQGMGEDYFLHPAAGVVQEAAEALAGDPVADETADALLLAAGDGTAAALLLAAVDAGAEEAAAAPAGDPGTAAAVETLLLPKAEYAAAAEAAANLDEAAAAAAAAGVLQPAAPELSRPVAPVGSGLTAAELAADFGAWKTGTEQHCRNNSNLQLPALIEGCLNNARLLRMTVSAPNTMFMSGKGVQTIKRTFGLPDKPRAGVEIGHAYEASDQETHAVAEAKVIAVEKPGQQLQYQLQLHGTIPGAQPSRGSRDDADALAQLEPRFYMLLATMLLFMYRGEAVLTKNNAWGALRHVRPITGKGASASGAQDSG
jgi:hypothetical protein